MRYIDRLPALYVEGFGAIIYLLSFFYGLPNDLRCVTVILFDESHRCIGRSTWVGSTAFFVNRRSARPTENGWMPGEMTQIGRTSSWL